MAATDILYVRYQLADLVSQAAFLRDFGLTEVPAADGVLRMRGAVSAGPFMYEAVQGADDRFLGFGLRLDDLAWFERLASLPGSRPVEPVDAMDGSLRLRLVMPDGFEIDAVYGTADATPLPVRAPNAFNAGQRKQRINSSVRQRGEPVAALRLGHVVLHVSDHAASVSWLREHFGLLASDFFAPPGEPENVIGTFMRVDRGAELVDHHCLFVLHSEHVGVHHCSFEVQDLDQVMAAHDYLLSQGYRLDCGVGRHMLGSQIYDYWRDAAGFRVEHYTDGDVVDKSYRPEVFCGTADETTQWGHKPDKSFFD